MNFDQPTNPEETPRIEIEQVLHMIGAQGFGAEAKALYGKFLDQEQALVKTSIDNARLNIKMADVYLAVGDIDGALESLEETRIQVGQEMSETEKPVSARYLDQAEKDISAQSFKVLYREIMDKIETVEKMKGE